MIRLLAGAVIVVVAFVSMDASARQKPREGTADKRIKTVSYNPNDVVAVRGYYGFTTLIEFSAGEDVEIAAAGDTIGWQVAPVGNRVLIKPQEYNAKTNLQVITNRRTYSFELTSGTVKSAQSGSLTFVLKFRYPEDERIALEAANAARKRHKQATVGEDGKTPADWNMAYESDGDDEVAPIRVLDDGQFTYFEFNNLKDLPAIFLVNADQSESLVNFRVEGKYVVVERLGGRFTTRKNDLVACIYNMSWEEITARPAGAMENKEGSWQHTDEWTPAEGG